MGSTANGGEKLGMLERTRQAVPSAAPVYQTQSAHTVAGAQQPVMNIQPRDTIRIASFNLSGWGDARRDQPAVTEMLVRLIGQFDVIALQDIRSKRDDLLPNLMIELNRGGRAFDFMIGPRIGRGETREQLAFVFDTDRIETDRFQLYTVADPEDIVTREPLVGWFRTKHVNQREAFTFSLVNMHVDSNLAAAELDALPNLVEAIFNDGRGEDDVILAGDFSALGLRLRSLLRGCFVVPSTASRPTFGLALDRQYIDARDGQHRIYGSCRRHRLLAAIQFGIGTSTIGE